MSKSTENPTVIVDPVTGRRTRIVTEAEADRIWSERIELTLDFVGARDAHREVLRPVVGAFYGWLWDLCHPAAGTPGDGGTHSTTTPDTSPSTTSATAADAASAVLRLLRAA